MDGVCSSRLSLWRFSANLTHLVISGVTELMMIRPTLACLLLCVVFGSSKPTEKKSRVHEEEPLSNLEHDDKKSFDYDHEAFLGHDEAKTFDQLAPEESRRRLRWVLSSCCTSDFNSTNWFRVVLPGHWQASSLFSLTENWLACQPKKTMLFVLLCNKETLSVFMVGDPLLVPPQSSSCLSVSAASLWTK